MEEKKKELKESTEFPSNAAVEALEIDSLTDFFLFLYVNLLAKAMKSLQANRVVELWRKNSQSV